MYAYGCICIYACELVQRPQQAKHVSQLADLQFELGAAAHLTRCDSTDRAPVTFRGGTIPESASSPQADRASSADVPVAWRK